MKALRYKSLMGLLYAVLLAIPMVSIISRVIYVQSNKNAYQSYGGTTQQIESVTPIYKYTSNEILTNEDYVIGHIYQLNDFSIFDMVIGDSLDISFTILNDSGDISFEYVATEDLYRDESFIYSLTSYTLHLELDSEGASASTISGSNGVVFTYDIREIYVSDVVIYLEDIQDNLSENRLSTYLSYTDFNIIDDIEINYTEVSTLDNVFEYSVDSIIQENNFGKIDFLSWFSNMFLDNTNAVNNRYVHFANWYLNYVMFISCVYLLFLVLMWFINFARRLLDRGMNYDW